MVNNHPHSKRVVVIGGGLGGLSAAISLAGAGFKVCLLEKNDKLGGKLNLLTKAGFSFDLGPSILTMPHVFESLFARAGKKLADYVNLVGVEPHWRNFFEDGTVVDLCGDPERQAQEFGKLSETSYTEFLNFIAYSKALTEETERGYFDKGIDGFWELIKHYGPIRSMSGFDVFRTMDQGVRRHIKHPKLVEIFNYFIKYVGSSPYDAPALLNLLPYIQYHYGLWYVRGGMYQLARAMEKLAVELGVEIRLDTEVVEISHDQGRAQSVRLADGESVSADILVSNMEIIPAHRRLLRADAAELNKLKKFQPSCSGMVLHLGIDRQYPQLAHHNFFYSNHPKAHFDAVFHRHTLSDDPTIYLVAPVRDDPALAPEGCDIIKILPHIPHLDPEKPLTDADYSAFRGRVIGKLERMGLTDLSRHIICEEYWTPKDIEARYYSNLGSIYGVVSDRNLNLGFKAPQRSATLSNLYFVGGSVNPGGGMPMVTLSGQRVADKIIADTTR